MTTALDPAPSLYLGGRWTGAHAGAGYRRLNPADPDDVVGDFADADGTDVDLAVGHAQTAQPAWAALGLIRRGQVLAAVADLIRERSEVIAAVMTREEGKPLPEARGELLRTADVFDYFAGEASRPHGYTLASYRPHTRIQTAAYPLGVVGLITPFNFPAFIPAFKLGPALLAGNSVIWKVAPATPGTGQQLVDIFTECGVPTGVISYLTGSGPDLGRALVGHPGVNAISFTGSTAVGLAVGAAAAARNARVQLEMGGKNTMVVLADCDLDRAVAMAAESAFSGTGQKCTAAGRILVQASILDEFADRLGRAGAAMVVGPGADVGVQIGPLVDDSARLRVQGLIEDAQAAGAVRQTDAAPSRPGHFLEPAVLTRVPRGSRLYDEEIFGPVAAITAVADLEEAIALTNDTAYGLTAAIHTENLTAALRFADSVAVGVVNVNQPTTGVEPHAPFGGVGLSGSAQRELGPKALDFYTREQTQVITIGGSP